MTFEVTPKVLQGLLNNVCEGITRSRRAKFSITLSARRNQISIIGNGMKASKSIPVRGQGQCQLGWKKLNDILATYPQEEPIRFECNRKGLMINNFSMQVERYEAKPVTEKKGLPSVEILPSRRKPSDAPKPPSECSSDGFSQMPPPKEDYDCTGRPGMVLPEDAQKEREPFVCPVCGRVGYFEKWKFKNRICYSRHRTWVAADAAHTFVIINGGERRCLCPRCVTERAATNPQAQPIPNKQADMFDNPDSEP
jgi:hypothetical protein